MPTTLQRLSGRVWLYPGDPDPANIQGCVAVIEGDGGSTLVDAGHSPGLARRIGADIAEAGLPAPARIVYTHHHWDHTWGACAWGDVEVVGHESGAKLLAEDAARPWSEERLREGMAAEPNLEASFTARIRAMADGWDGFRVVPPTTTFTDDLTLPDGIEVRHVGGEHAPDSAIVVVPDASVMLLGDCFYPPPAAVRQKGDGTDFAMVRRLLGEGCEWYVDSHSEPHRRRGWSAAVGLMTAAGRFRRRGKK